MWQVCLDIFMIMDMCHDTTASVFPFFRIEGSRACPEHALPSEPVSSTRAPFEIADSADESSPEIPSVMDVKREGIAAYVTPGSSRRDNHFPVGRSDAVTHFGVHRL